MRYSFVREDIDFYSEGTRCSGWLYLPQTGVPGPIIVMAHGLGALRDMRLNVYAERFASAGYACFLFDYRNFGASDGEHRQLISVIDQLADWQHAIEFIKRESRINPDQLFLFGTSFSGGHVIELSAIRRDIKATIAQCPYTDTWATTRAVPLGTLVKMFPMVVADYVSMLTGYHPQHLKLVAPKGELALMVMEADNQSIEQFIGEANFINQVPARTLVEFLKYSPGKYARMIQQPIYFAICEKDTIAPAEATLKWARQANQATIKVYNCEHFEIYLEPMFDKVIADYIDFYNQVREEL